MGTRNRDFFIDGECKILIPACRTLELGFSLGDFLCEAGWYPAAITVNRGCVSILRRMNQTEPNYVCVKLECLSKVEQCT